MVVRDLMEGLSLLWKRGKHVAWDVSDATSDISDAAVCWKSCQRTAVKKSPAYAELCRNFIFVPLACAVSAAWCADDLKFMNDQGSRISGVTGDTRDMGFLFQRLCIALQKGNAACMNKPGPLIDTLE